MNIALTFKAVFYGQVLFLSGINITLAACVWLSTCSRMTWQFVMQ